MGSVVMGTLGRASVDVGDFADLTSVTVTSVGWTDDGQVIVTFDGDLTANQAQAVADRIASRNTNEETLRARARTALANNSNYLALPSPTTAQAVAQVAALTRETNALIRMALGALDSTA